MYRLAGEEEALEVRAQEKRERIERGERKREAERQEAEKRVEPRIPAPEEEEGAQSEA